MKSYTYKEIHLFQAFSVILIDIQTVSCEKIIIIYEILIASLLNKKLQVVGIRKGLVGTLAHEKIVLKISLAVALDF